MERDKSLFEDKLVDNREPRESLLHDFIDSSDDIFYVLDSTEDVDFSNDRTLLTSAAVNGYLSVDIPEECIDAAELAMDVAEDTVISDGVMLYGEYIDSESGVIVDELGLIEYFGTIEDLDSYIYEANSVDYITRQYVDSVIYDRIRYFTNHIAYVDYVEADGGEIVSKRDLLDYFKEIV